MSQNGYIKLHRKITEWEWYDEANTFRLFLHLLLTANHKENKWQGVVINKGQLVTSYSQLAKKMKLSVKSVRTSLNRLKSTNEVASESTNHYTIITILKYALYQADERLIGTPEGTPEGRLGASKGQAKGKQRATNKNDKNDKNDKNTIDIPDKPVKQPQRNFIKPTLDLVTAYCLERQNNISPQHFIDYYEANGWKVGKNSMIDWKACIRTWEQNHKKDKPKEVKNLGIPC